MLFRRLLVIATLVSALAGASPAMAMRGELPPELVDVVGQGWIYLENGNLDKALELFTAAHETDAGKDYAEVYYSLAMVWWERRNSLASLRWLDEAVKGRGRLSWKRGANKEWDHRIDGRRRFIERNFTVVKLRPPDRALGLPPLADPPPRDPLLRQFTDHVSNLVEDAYKEGIYNLWVLLPNGTYWVGDELYEHRGGELDMTKAREWDLPIDRVALRKSFNRRVEAIASGSSEAQEIIDATRKAQADAEQRAEVVRNLRPLTYTSVAHADARRVSADITSSWPLDSFRMRYMVLTEGADSAHEVRFPKLGFVVAFEADGRLRIQAKKRVLEELGADWRTGLSAMPNNVEIVFDGADVSVTANGLSFGPITVRKGGPTGNSTEWELWLSDDAGALRAIEISKYEGAPTVSLDRGR